MLLCVQHISSCCDYNKATKEFLTPQLSQKAFPILSWTPTLPSSFCSPDIQTEHGTGPFPEDCLCFCITMNFSQSFPKYDNDGVR